MFDNMVSLRGYPLLWKGSVVWPGNHRSLSRSHCLHPWLSDPTAYGLIHERSSSSSADLSELWRVHLPLRLSGGDQPSKSGHPTVKSGGTSHGAGHQSTVLHMMTQNSVIGYLSTTHEVRVPCVNSRMVLLPTRWVGPSVLCLLISSLSLRMIVGSGNEA